MIGTHSDQMADNWNPFLKPEKRTGEHILFRHFSLSIVVLLACIVGNSLQAQTRYLDKQFDFNRTRDVVYANKPVEISPGSIDLKLELFSPAGDDVPVAKPAVILIHGGGFVNGSRFNLRLIEMCEDMAQRGWVCVSIDYRLAGDKPIISDEITSTDWWATLPPPGQSEDDRTIAIVAAMEDTLSVHRWLTANAESLGVDTSRIGIGGSSAGAITALLASYVLDDLGLLNKGDIDAVYDMWGGLLGLDNTYMQADDAALLISHGEDDPTVEVSQAYDLRDRAEAINLPYEMHIESNRGHGFNIFTVQTRSGETHYERFVAFFYKHVILEKEQAGDFVGSWFNTAQSGHGFSVAFGENTNGEPVAVVYWYTYDDQGQPIFLLGTGNIADAVLTVQFESPVGMQYGQFDPASVVREDGGTARFEFVDAQNATFSYTPSAFSSATWGHTAIENLPLQRLFMVPPKESVSTVE